MFAHVDSGWGREEQAGDTETGTPGFGGREDGQGRGWSERDQEEQSVRSLEERRQDKVQMEMSLKLVGDADRLRSRLKVTGSVWSRP